MEEELGKLLIQSIVLPVRLKKHLEKSELFETYSESRRKTFCIFSFSNLSIFSRYTLFFSNCFISSYAITKSGIADENFLFCLRVHVF